MPVEPVPETDPGTGTLWDWLQWGSSVVIIGIVVLRLLGVH